MSCRVCQNKELKKIISLGESPLANNLINSIEEEYEKYPLKLMFCDQCFNCQLSEVVPPEKMFDNYLYVSSTSKKFRQHFKLAAKKYIKEFNLNEKSLVIDIGSNDGIALKPFKEEGVNVMGVEPAVNISKTAIRNGIPTKNCFFNKDTFDSSVKADIITASNVFAHSDRLKEMATNAFSFLKEDGTFIIEVQYLLNTIQDLTFDNIYHEHVNYWSVTSINNFFTKLNLFVNNVEHIDTHGGSIRVYVERHKNQNPSVKRFLKKEKEFGLLNYETYLDFANKIQKIKSNTKNNFKKIKKQSKTIAAYGAPAKATTLLNFFDITSKDIDYIIEDNELKHNKFIPNVNIPIFSKEKLKKTPPNCVVVMAWNFFSEIKKSNIDLIKSGVKFISIKDLEKV